MHGSIFVLLRRFVELNYDHSTWLKLLEAAGIAHDSYQMREFYPTREIYAIVEVASKATGVPAYDLMEKYGEFLVPDLLMMYSKYIDPSWRTYEMLENTEASMHGAVRNDDNRADPPVLLVTRKGSKQLIVDYYSKRRMSAVAVGIIKGIAKYYNESDKVTVTPLSGPEEERVQISVDFK